MSRRKAREIALQVLFQLDLNGAEEKEQEAMYETLAVDTALGESEKISGKDRIFLKALVRGTRENLQAIDASIASCSHDWKLSRMATVDRNIARMAAYEIFFAENRLSPGIAINEAVELAKKFGTDESSRYVNGILGAMVKAQRVND